jgi:hypothetical protein
VRNQGKLPAQNSMLALPRGMDYKTSVKDKENNQYFIISINKNIEVFQSLKLLS